MRVLLDEQLPRQLARQLADVHQVSTVQERGWSGLRDRDVLHMAAACAIDVFITADQNLEHQQNLVRRPFGVLILIARSNSMRDLSPLVGGILRAIPCLLPGQVTRIQA